MKTIEPELITKEVSRLCIEAATYIEHDVLACIKKAMENEEGLSKEILSQIIENDELAKRENVPMCQDTGITVVFVEIGYDCHINGDLYEAINKGISEGYTKNDVVAMAIVGQTEDPISPCGACRQVMEELLNGSTPVVLANLERKTKEMLVSELLPYSFGQKDL